MDQHQDAPALTDRLEQIRERVEAASAGPWELIGGGEYVTGAGICVAPDDGGVTLKDAKFIAHARQDVPWLLAELERLAAAEAEKRDLIEECLRLKNKATALSTVVDAVKAVVGKYAGGTLDRPAGDILDEISAVLDKQSPFPLPTTAPATIEAKSKASGNACTFVLVTDGRDYRMWRDEYDQLWPGSIILSAYTDHHLIQEEDR